MAAMAEVETAGVVGEGQARGTGAVGGVRWGEVGWGGRKRDTKTVMDGTPTLPSQHHPTVMMINHCTVLTVQHTDK